MVAKTKPRSWVWPRFQLTRMMTDPLLGHSATAGARAHISGRRLTSPQEQDRNADIVLHPAGGCAEDQIGHQLMPVGAHG